MKRISRGAAVVSAMLVTVPAFAADPDIVALREELAEVRQIYEKRLSTLEARLAQYEGKAARSEAKAVSAEVIARKAVVAASQKPASEAAFNPAISAVLMATYGYTGRDPNHYAIQGFIPTGGDVTLPRRNFSLGESEIGIAADIDHLFRGQLTLSLPPKENTIALEEAFAQTLSLGSGTTLRVGRFFSGIGYLNGQHAHAWDFVDAPLVYKVMLGGQLHSDGLQVKWIAPTDLFLEFGGELANGGPFPSTDRSENGATMYALFAHAGGDVGLSSSWRAGVSWLNTSPRDRAYQDMNRLGNAVTDAFSGRSNLLIADGIWKWAPEGNATDRSLVLQGEFFLRDEQGLLRYDLTGAALSGDYAAQQAGLYGQVLYQFIPHWRIGYRFDWLDSGSHNIGLVDSGALSSFDFPLLGGFSPKRHSVMLDWTPSEFSRIRFQYARDDASPGRTDNQLWVQLITSFGAHGAHHF